MSDCYLLLDGSNGRWLAPPGTTEAVTDHKFRFGSKITEIGRSNIPDSYIAAISFLTISCPVYSDEFTQPLHRK